MLNTKVKYTLPLAVLIAATSLTQGQTTPTATTTAKPAPAAPQPTAYDKWEKAVKNPTPWLSWGADLRLRNEYIDNAITLNDGAKRHEQDYFRFRERLWTSITPLTNLSLNARVAAEQREWMKPSYASQYNYQSGLEERYGILDNANVKWSNAFDQPLTITGGRQDIQFGDPLNWWLVADGTPGDGSWTFFLDSIRATYEAKEIKTKLDVVYIYQNAMPDEWIPTVGRSGDNKVNGALKPYYLTEQTEQGVIVYLSNKSIKNTQIDGYFIYKHDNQEDDIRSPYGTPLGDNADIYTFGGKITGTPAEHWKYSLEGAYQFGNKMDPMLVNDDSGITAGTANTQSRDISAYGMNASLTYLFKDRYNNQAGLMFEYLSGDDPNTEGTDEMFDVLWGRWPRWSELYIYSYINENGGKIAQLNNIIRFGPTWSISPIKNMTFSATYNALYAPEETPTRAFSSQLSQYSQDGHFRGHFLQSVLKHKFNDHVSAHLWSEFVWMGDYYTHEDLMTFFRAEMLFTF